MTLNANIPSFKALVKKSYFTKKLEDKEFYDVYVFGLQSCSGRILTFHVMTDSGMLRSRVPISEIYTREPVNDIPFNFKMLWDNFSENVSVIEYDFLAFHRAQIVLRDGSKVWGTYMFTVDWYNNPYSDEPSDYKCGHVFEADDGYLLCQPNNRIFWKDSNWVTKPLPENLKQFKVDTELVSVENKSDRWVTEDTNSFYYDVRKDDVEVEKLKRELKVTEQLLDDRQRLLDAIPECKTHGKCVPHALEWIEEQKNKNHV